MIRLFCIEEFNFRTKHIPDFTVALKFVLKVFKLELGFYKLYIVIEDN